ncbi:MAG: SCO2322 family protein [Actinomycetota bacterium]
MLKKFFLVTVLFTLVQIPSANAETGYRYWGYFQAPAGASSWTAAMTGPSVEVRDGDVEGWTFTASSNDIPATPPMMDPDFAELCGEVSEVAGKVRVGLVVDFGAGQIAPSGETPREFFRDCVVVDQGSVGLDVLNAVLDVRAADSGLICGIAGYPAQECGAEIDMSVLNGPEEEPLAIEQTGENEVANNNSIALIGLAVIALLAGVVALRRRSAK